MEASLTTNITIHIPNMVHKIRYTSNIPPNDFANYLGVSRLSSQTVYLD